MARARLVRLVEQLLGGQGQYSDSLGVFIVFSFNFGLLGYITLTYHLTDGQARHQAGTTCQPQAGFNWD